MNFHLSSQQEGINNKDKALLLGILFIPCILIQQTLNNDIWFILNNGRYIFQYGIPHMEPFTLHQGLSYVMQQWLTSVIFWAIYGKLGILGLNALIVIIFAAIIWTVFNICLRISKGNLFVSFTVTLFSSIFTSIFMVQRPFIFFILIIAIQIYLLESYIAEKRLKYLLPLPLLSVLLVNFQAAMWPVLFVIIAPYVIDSFKFKLFALKGQGYPKRALFIVLAIMILAGIINPYGIDGMTYLFRSYGYQEINIYVNEMKPMNINDLAGKIFFSGVFCVIMTYFIYKKGDTRLRYVLLTIGTIIMTFSSGRSFSIFCICGIAPLAYFLRGVKVTESKMRKEGNGKTVLIRGILIFIISILAVFTLYGNYHNALKEMQVASLSGAVNYVLNNNNIDNIVLYAGYNDGGYAEFRGLKPYIDPRAEVFVKKNNKKEDIMKEYILLQSGSTYYRKFLDKYNFTHLIVSKGDILFSYLFYDADYKITYSNKEYRVYEKIK